MYYLFNSAARPTYVNNLMNTLYLPIDTVNKYQYEKYEHNYIDYKTLNTCEDDDCVIVFIDRYDDDPSKNKYIPIRFGKVIKKVEDEGKLYFYVLLKEFIKVDDAVCSDFKTRFSKKLFYCKNGSENGYLVFADNEKNKLISESDKDAWNKIVRYISACHLLQKCNCAFNRFAIVDKNGEIVLPKHTEENSYYLLDNPKKYRINIYYYIPFGFDTYNSKQMKFSFFDSSMISFDKNVIGVKEGKLEGKFIREFDTIFFDFKLEYDSNLSQTDCKIEIRKKKKNFFVRLLPYALFSINLFVSSMATYISGKTDDFIGKNDIVSKIANSLDTSKLAVIIAITSILSAGLLAWIKARKND